MTPPGPKPAAVEARRPSRISLWQMGVAIMMASVVAFIAFMFVHLFLPANWTFAIEAATEIVEVELPPKAETRWRIDGATLCTRSKSPPNLPDRYRVGPEASPCGSRAWSGWRVSAPEQVLRMNGGATVTAQIQPEGGFAMSLRRADEASLGSFSVVGLIDEIDMSAPVNLIWTAIPSQSITLPFSGTTTLGRAVSWSADRMLQDGSVVVYTADESADKRAMVDEADLMLGDQVRIGEPKPVKHWPKGFIRATEGAATMQVIAFGRANSLHIVRFGESGYEFKPGLVRKLAADRAIAFWGSVLVAYITLILGLQPFMGSNGQHGSISNAAARIRARLKAWRHRQSGQ